MSTNSFETIRMILPSVSEAKKRSEQPAMAAVSAAGNIVAPIISSEPMEKTAEPGYTSGEMTGLKNRRTGEEVALTMHFNDEKISLERQVEQDIKKLHTQLKLLHTDLLPSPVRPRVQHIEDLINSLVRDFKQLLNAHTTELELYTHRVGSAQLLAEYAENHEEQEESGRWSVASGQLKK